MKYRLTVLFALLGLLVVSPVFAIEGETSDDPNSVNFRKILAAVEPSLVSVEYTLQYDKGEGPRDTSPIKQERPLEVAGFLLTDKTVVTSDIIIHPRFIKSIEVRYGDKTVKATPISYVSDQRAQLLQLETPLTGAKPLGEFAMADKDAKLFAVFHFKKGQWTSRVSALSKSLVLRQGEKAFSRAPARSLIVDAEGNPVAMAMDGRLMLDSEGEFADNTPQSWKLLSKSEVEQDIEKVKKLSRAGIVRVALSFRSPKKKPGFDRYSRRGEDQETERNVLGMMIKPDKILVLTHLKPKVTARLERIVVHAADGTKLSAKFERSLLDYGCFIAKLEKPMKGAVKFSKDDIVSSRVKLLIVADVRLQGENRTDYFNHDRITGFRTGWRSNLYPRLVGTEDIFLFDADGKLVAFPVARREKASTESSWRDVSPTLTASSNFAKVFDDLAANTDKDNIPLKAEEENRLAWLGVEMQRLNKELARANNVADQSRDGQIGAIVSYVYSNSPAAKAGIEIGDILLRLHIEDQPKPLEVELDYGPYEGRSFPWDRLGELPEQYFDRIPSPWPSAESKITRSLTDIGFGKKFQAELFKGGKIVKLDMVITESPAHHDSAGKFKSKAIGLTVKNLTYEVRRYFHKTDADPGVIVAKIEPGSKTSVSGIKPFEIITHVNGKEIMNADDFEKLIAGQDELRFSVKRMDKGREVKIKLKSAATQPATTQPTKPAVAL